MEKGSSIDEILGEVAFQGDVDPKTRVRSKPMRLIVIGMPRTGTMSQRAALTRLGFDVHHMVSVLTNPKDAILWREAFESKYNPARGGKCSLTRKEWDMLLGDNDACIDFPSAAFTPEIIAAYPEAKVIVSQRPADRWFTSYDQTVGKAQRDVGMMLMCLLDPVMRPCIRMFMSMNNTWLPVQPKDRDGMMARYNAMHDEVRALMRQPGNEGRMLEYKLGDGWKPLCDFLGVPAPPESEPFPRVNDTAEFGKRVGALKVRSMRRVAKSMATWVGTGLVAGAVAYYAFFWE